MITRFRRFHGGCLGGFHGVLLREEQPWEGGPGVIYGAPFGSFVSFRCDGPGSLPHYGQENERTRVMSIRAWKRSRPEMREGE